MIAAPVAAADSRRLRPVARAFGAAALAALLLSGCVTPATGRDSYRDKALTSLDAASGEVATARLTIRQLGRGRLFGNYADETVTANETALGAISDAFGSVQPPRGDDRVRSSVTSLLSDAQDAVSAARISVRRADGRGLAEAARQLRNVADDLSHALARLS